MANALRSAAENAVARAETLGVTGVQTDPNAERNGLVTMTAADFERLLDRLPGSVPASEGKVA